MKPIPTRNPTLSAPAAARRGERGMALLFTLGIMSLIVVLGLTFATTASIDSKVAFNYNNGVRARLIAQTGVERTMMMLTFSEKKILEGDPTYYLDTTEKHDEWSENWQYIKFRDDKDGQVKYFGRYKYDRAVIGPRLDPSASVTPLVNETTGASTTVATEERPGIRLTEINLAKLDVTNAIVNTPTHPASHMTFAQKLNFVGTGTGTLPAGTRWADYDQMFTAMGVDLDVGNVTNKQYRKWLQVGADPDIEAFYVKTSPGVLRRDKMYHRFNLARTAAQWDAMVVADLLTPAGVLVKWTNADHDGAYIPWFKEHTADTAFKLTFADNVDRVGQIIANLIDYCDADDVPESDVDPNTWSDVNIPKYTGNELTGYINEVWAQVDTVLAIGGAAPNYNYEYTFQLTLGGELINIYNVNLGDYDLHFYGQIKYRIHGEEFTKDFQDAVACPDLPVDIALGASAYGWTAEMAVDESISKNAADNTSADVVILELKITHVALAKDGAVSKVDFASLPVGDGFTMAIENQPLLTGSEAIAKKISCAWRVVDPRQNLNLDDWTITRSAVGGNLPITLGAVNTGASPAAAGATRDLETTVDPSLTGGIISTAFIRNAPMKTPWELGCIHRGARWETLNLTKFHSTAENDLGIDIYTLGDANLLDQVKFGIKSECYGKLNLNINDPAGTTGSKEVLRALFANLYVHADYNNPGSKTGSRIEDSHANQIATSIIEYCNANPMPHYRSQIVNVNKLWDNTIDRGMTRDATKEAIIGKTMNLIKAEPSIIDQDLIVAQVIKDVGGNFTIQDKEIYDRQSNKWVMLEPIVCRYLNFEEHGDEILAETKVMATYKYEFGKYRILTYGFLE